MASNERSAASDIISRHFTETRTLSFFQAVQLLLSRIEPDCKPGEKGPFKDEAILFRGYASLGFSARDIETIHLTEDDSPLSEVVMDVNFMGLYGPASPLPVFFTENIIYDDPDDSEVRHFLDIFNHRFISFFYRSWLKYRYPLQYEPDASDPMSSKIYSLCGLKDKKDRDNSRIDWERMFPYIGMISANLQSTEVVSKVIRFYIGHDDAEIESNCERTLDIDAGQLIKLGQSNSSLGLETTLGRTVRDRMSKFKIRFNDLSLEKYLSLLPGSEKHKDIQELVRILLKEPMDFDTELNLNTNEVPRNKISKSNFFQLGRTSWLGQADSSQTRITYSTTA